ncbi:MAG: flavodoxin family protein [Coriobacteriia bacterium]
MKVVAFNCSARKDGNTALMLERALRELRAAGIQTELVQLAGKRVQGCTACLTCRETMDRQCHGRSDFGNECIAKIDEADGVIIGSPVYFADVTAEAKALIDRTGYVGRANDGMLRRKVGAAVVVHRRAGAVHAFDSINHLFFISEMIVPGASYWNMGVAGEKGAVADDEEAMRTMASLGGNMAWLLGKLHA